MSVRLDHVLNDESPKLCIQCNIPGLRVDLTDVAYQTLHRVSSSYATVLSQDANRLPSMVNL